MSKRSDSERDIVAEIINLVASQVSTGVRVAGEVREEAGPGPTTARIEPAHHPRGG